MATLKMGEGRVMRLLTMAGKAASEAGKIFHFIETIFQR
jgi:hypothetical protein